MISISASYTNCAGLARLEPSDILAQTVTSTGLSGTIFKAPATAEMEPEDVESGCGESPVVLCPQAEEDHVP